MFVCACFTNSNKPSFERTKLKKLHNVSALYIATLNTIFKFVFLLHVTH